MIAIPFEALATREPRRVEVCSTCSGSFLVSKTKDSGASTFFKPSTGECTMSTLISLFTVSKFLNKSLTRSYSDYHVYTKLVT
jgi:hypothetical protein